MSQQRPPEAPPGATTHSLPPSKKSSNTLQPEEGGSQCPVAVSEFHKGAKQFSGLLNRAIQELSAREAHVERQLQEGRELLGRERAELEKARTDFEEERRVVHQVTHNGSEQVRLSVGGLRFTTTVATLRNAPEPSLFAAMFSGRHKLRPDAEGCYFIDRDGRHFHDILNFLRDGKLNAPKEGWDVRHLLDLRAEADFYGLTGLLQLVDSYPWGLTRVVRATEINGEDGWMYGDGPDEVVFSVSAPCQLLGVGLAGHAAPSITVELSLFEVGYTPRRDEATPPEVTEHACLEEVAHTFFKADGLLPRLLLPRAVPLAPGRFYMACASIAGAGNARAEDCLAKVVAGGVEVAFHEWESLNGTDEQRGQFPELHLRTGAAVAPAALHAADLCTPRAGTQPRKSSSSIQAPPYSPPFFGHAR